MNSSSDLNWGLLYVHVRFLGKSYLNMSHLENDLDVYYAIGNANN